MDYLLIIKELIKIKNIIDKLYEYHDADDDELIHLIESSEADEYLYQKADQIRRKYYGTDVYIRGLIEITNYCKNNCFYCGIRAGNNNVKRYRLSKEEILECCSAGYRLGFRTFVLQGGEDVFFTDEVVCDIVSSIKTQHPDCAVTLSIGEKSYESYAAFFKAGADRYLLRHETADELHYCKLHPDSMKLSERKECLYNLKKIGYQTGAGFMVGSPYQTTRNLIDDIRFLQKLNPEMIGIGPFLSHKDTPFRDFSNGSSVLTLRMLAIVRLMFPSVLLPATTALGTASEDGREKGLKAGANVIMPNLSPERFRKLYELYDNKLFSGEESAQEKALLEKKVAGAGYKIVEARGDFISC